MEGENYKLLCALLIIIIIIIGIVFVSNKYVNSKQQKEIELNQTIIESYNSGVEYGYLFGITQVMSNSQNCNVVPLSYSNITINMIDVNCVR